LTRAVLAGTRRPAIAPGVVLIALTGATARKPS